MDTNQTELFKGAGEAILEEAQKDPQNGLTIILLSVGMVALGSAIVFLYRKDQKDKKYERQQSEARYNEERIERKEGEAKKEKFASEILQVVENVRTEFGGLKLVIAQDQAANRAVLDQLTKDTIELKGSVKEISATVSEHHTEILIIKGKLDKGL
jgi:ABC-type Na+ efflux pump permease subunit